RLLASNAEVRWRGAEAAGVADAMIEVQICIPIPAIKSSQPGRQAMRRAVLVVSRPDLKPILCVAVLLFILLLILLCIVLPALAQSVYNLRIHAIVLSDDDGSERSTITPQQVAAWVNKANAMLTAAGAGIQLQFDPNPNGPDWEAMRNTALNHL